MPAAYPDAGRRTQVLIQQLALADDVAGALDTAVAKSDRHAPTPNKGTVGWVINQPVLPLDLALRKPSAQCFRPSAGEGSSTWVWRSPHDSAAGGWLGTDSHRRLDPCDSWSGTRSWWRCANTRVRHDVVTAAWYSSPGRPGPASPRWWNSCATSSSTPGGP